MGNEIIVAPTTLTFGDTQRIVIARFGQPLPDDRYKIEVLGVSDAGLPAVKSTDDVPLKPRFGGTDRDTYYMNLELGAKVSAVVPQPLTRDGAGNLVQLRDTIEVYFNDDDLDKTSAETREFYQLILTRDSISPNDDSVFTPSNVVYDADQDKAVLTFASPIDTLAGGAGTFRLRIGSNRTVASSLTPQAPMLFTGIGCVRRRCRRHFGFGGFAGFARHYGIFAVDQRNRRRLGFESTQPQLSRQ